MTHLHILGISGTFMSALALLAREAGFEVTGSDAQCYPPISDLLAEKGIVWTEGYEDCTDALRSDCVIVGNAIKRGMPVMEAILHANKAYTSGPEWLAENILSHRQVIAVAGTHGKTTTTSMLAYILVQADLSPGFLIGGVSSDLNTSAQLGTGSWFVIEADEYDSAFFDKRPKFMHYRPKIAILNNLEFDHADIYADLAAIQLQFHYLLRTIPDNGLIIAPRDDNALNEVFSRGRYSALEDLALVGDATWRAELEDPSGSAFRVYHQGDWVARVAWSLMGTFNVENGLAAIAASARAGVAPSVAAKALESFTPVKRRLELKSDYHGVTVYDDFAHHPTAILKTLQALRRSQRHRRILVVLEFASYTMRTGVHAADMAKALSSAHRVFVLNPREFDLQAVASNWQVPYEILADTAALAEAVVASTEAGDAVVVMSNRGFDNMIRRIITGIQTRHRAVS